MRPCVWHYPTCDEAAATRLAATLRVPPVLARLLCQRGLADPDVAARFLAPRLDHLHDPFALADMRVAVERLEAAIARRERIAIHGDYDVDGVTSTVMLRRALHLLGADVTHFIPERIRDGYGLQVPAVERLHAEGVHVLVSVDCGIRSEAAARRARELGLDLIITDHHEPDGTLPGALAVINPKRPDCSYPEKHLAGAGVALKLVQALCARAGREKWLPAFVKMAALGTLADVVPLLGENRTIASIGLERLTAGPNSVGLRALIEASGLAGRTITSHHVAFGLAPRVNAAGRMSSPDIAARLLLAFDETERDAARELAALLNEENQRRQAEEASIVAEARRVIEANPDIGAHNALVVAGEGWHRGVIGIVASKLVEAYCKPAVVVALEGETAHGSCRSIAPFDMLAGLELCADLLDRFGGHRQAAGLSMPAARVGELRARLGAHADAILSPGDLVPRVRIDADLPLADITPELVAGLQRLEPFGMGNPRPVFSASAVAIPNGPTRLKERHLSMSVRQGPRVFRAIAWRAAERLDFLVENRDAIDLAYTIEQNHYRGETTLELGVSDVRAVATSRPAPAASDPGTTVAQAAG